MLLRCAALLIASALAAAPNAALAADPNAAAPASEAQEEGPTTEVFHEEDEGLDLPYLVLRLPEAFFELAFTPLFPLVKLAEDIRLNERLFDLLTNDELTAFFVPIVDFSTSHGFGGGAVFFHNDLLGGDQDLLVMSRVKGNLNQSHELSYSERLPSLDGRKLSAGVSYVFEHDHRFFGIGNDTVKEAESALIAEHLEGFARFQVADPSESSWTGAIEARWRRIRLDAGEDVNLRPVLPGGPLGLPPGYGRTLNYPELMLAVGIDTRDARGRTTKGVFGSLELRATKDVEGAKLGGLIGTARVAWLIPVLPLARVLVLSGGLSAAAPLFLGDELPLHTLVTMGGASMMRGYTSDRFRDRMGWWTLVEYRWPITEYSQTDIGFSSTMFVEAGRVGHDLEDLFSRGPIRASGGIGLRIETALFLVLRLQLAMSSEGLEVSVSLNDIL